MSSTERFAHLRELGPNFWNLRAKLPMVFGLIDVGNHMSFVRLANGKILVIDTCEVTPEAKAEIDVLTDHGKLIDGVVGTHPFHTLYFTPFHKLYPDAAFYGTPRHIKRIKDIKWAGSITAPEVMKKWEPEVFFSATAGCDIENPPEDNHFADIFAFHKESKTLHVDDTLSFFDKSPGILLHLAGLRKGKIRYHPQMASALTDPLEFKSWLKGILDNWDFENLATAHDGVLLGDANARVRQVLNATEHKFDELAKNLKK